MAKAYDRDLRVRVVAAIEAGASTAAAAERFGIGKATGRGVGAAEAGQRQHCARQAGQAIALQARSACGLHFGLLDETIDISLAEIAARLQAERDVRVVPATIWYFFARRDWTFKKRRPTPASKRAKTSPPRAQPGSRARSTSIRNA